VNSISAKEITFIKVDVEGFEPHVLKGAANLLKLRKAMWQIELAPRYLVRAGSSLKELVKELPQHFASFVDLSYPKLGIRQSSELDRSFDYLISGKAKNHTDLLLFSHAQHI
jgi:hypothetical protein